MDDTIKIVSPDVPETLASAVEWSSSRMCKFAIARPDVLQWEITKAEPVGSYEHRISVRVEREKWVCAEGGGVLSWRPGMDWEVPALQQLANRDTRKTKPKPVRVSCPPRIVVEGSVHKAMVGNNITGGPTNPQASARYMVGLVSRLLGVPLPSSGDWSVDRWDNAQVYDLGLQDAVWEYILGLNNCTFPRRDNVQRHGKHSLSSPGQMAVIKVYSKFDEFKVHDAVRLQPYYAQRNMQHVYAHLKELTQGLLRVEVELKGRKLRKDFGGECRVADLTQKYVEAAHFEEVGKLIREARADMQVVRQDTEVMARLAMEYGDSAGRPLYASWVILSTRGELFLKNNMSRRTYYDHLKKLAEAGISWHGTNVRLQESTAIPKGFSPVASDRFRCVSMLPQVAAYSEPLLLAA